MIVNDAWGQIRIESKYEKIINSKEFNDMKNKTQLGLCCNTNAIHTRYQHSIGTYYLACRLIEISKNKFSNILNITKEDEEAIKCMALVHDIGHGCFSHVSEKYLDGTHENRTELILLDQNTEIHQAIVSTFGEKVLQKIVDLIRMKEKIKEKYSVNNDNNLMLITAKLLSGGIDIDRIDYIFRDSKYVKGEMNDFLSILESIDLEYIGDSLEVVFDESVEFTIANFFNKRFELYDTLYYDNQTKLLEFIFGKFLKRAGIKLNWDTTEIEMNNIFRERMTSEDEQIKRYASILNMRKIDSSFIVREINDKNSYEFYRSKLFTNVPELEKYSDCLFEGISRISIYDQNNKVFINKSGLIKDISDCSKILNSELKKEKYVIAVDMLLLTRLLAKDLVPQKEIDKIIKKVKKATTVEIEQEKKYIFKGCVSPKKSFIEIKEKLALENAEYIDNFDTYYDDNNILETYRIAVRKRTNNGSEEWTIKRPLNDKTSISKRDEKNFGSMEEVLTFLQQGWKIPIKNLTEKITLKTLREKYDIKYGDGSFELVFDETIPILDGQEYESSFMIECELKSGNSSGLFFIDEIIKQFSFMEECNFSKKEIALEAVKDKTKTNPFDTKLVVNQTDYDKRLVHYFTSSPELLDRLKELDKKKQEVRRLVDKYGDLKTPIVVTVSGTPRAGKTTCINNLCEFLRKADLKISCVEEPAGIVYQGLKNKEEKKRLLADRVGFVDQQYAIGEEHINKKINGSDVVLCDRGIIDTFIWYDMYYQLGMIDEQQYKDFIRKIKYIRDYHNQFYALYADSEEAMKRDFVNSISLEPRTTMSEENVERYNNSMIRMLPLIEEGTGTAKLINTTKSGILEPSIEVANAVLDNVKRLYLRK